LKPRKWHIVINGIEFVEKFSRSYFLQSLLSDHGIYAASASNYLVTTKNAIPISFARVKRLIAALLPLRNGIVPAVRRGISHCSDSGALKELAEFLCAS
jgi:hypothetical protein